MDLQGRNMKFTAAIYSLGNIGTYAVQTLQTMPDCIPLGVIRRSESLGTKQLALRGLPEYASFDDLVANQGKPDVILNAAPSRQVPETSAQFLKYGCCVVDSFDIHDRVPDVFEQLDAVAKSANTVSILSAGWDPGTDSMIRALFCAMIPCGTSFTNFGRGRSMGHSVAARAIKGVADATSITIPIGGGRHSRLVYVVLKDGFTLDEVFKAIKADPYFANDPLEVRAVTQEELPLVADNSHGVLLERSGASGMTDNQRLSFEMKINNPALTAQIMASCARAAIRMRKRGTFGAFTMIDLPPVDLLPCDRLENIKHLV